MTTQHCCRLAACCAIVTLTAGTAASQEPTRLAPERPLAEANPRRTDSPLGATRAVEQASTPTTIGLDWLVRSTIEDFRLLPSKQTATILAIGATGAWLSNVAADRGATRVMSRSETLDEILDPGVTIGSARMQLAGALATYGVGRLSRSPKVASLGADLLRAQLLTQTLTAGIKMSVRRTRPDGTQFSFPSGHSSVSFASATVIQRHFGLKAGIPAYAVASFVAASRVQERRHFLSDVAFGAALGIAAGHTVTVGRGRASFALAPTVVPSGAGVSLNWLGSK